MVGITNTSLQLYLSSPGHYSKPSQEYSQGTTQRTLGSLSTFSHP